MFNRNNTLKVNNQFIKNNNVLQILNKKKNTISSPNNKNIKKNEKEKKKIKNFKFRESMFTIDKKNLNDPNKIAIFSKDIFKYYKEQEPNFLFKFKELNSNILNIRFNSIEKLFEFVDKLNYSDDTLYLSVYIYDFYLNQFDFEFNTEFILILIITSIFIAAKFQEITYINLNRILNRLNTNDLDIDLLKTKIIDLENEILFKIEFNLNLICNNDILKRIIMFEQLDNQYYILASFLIELCLYHPLFYKYLPSEKAIGSLLYVMKFYGINLDTRKLKANFNYNENKINEFQNIISKMRLIQQKRNLYINKKSEDDIYLNKKLNNFYELKLI